MQKQLPGGLILRSLSEGYATDRQRLPQFYADVNAGNLPEEGKNRTIVWTNDLISGHPTVTLDDIFVVVDPAQDDYIASATLLIPQTWRYEEIPLAVGRPELVGTRPEYRARGLSRALMEVVHERSAALGHQLQAITGIEHFYRKFGYTMAVDLGEPHASLPMHVVADPAPDYKPAYTLRPATADDIPDIARWHTYMARERLLTEARSMNEWHYEVMGRNPDSTFRMAYLIIVNVEGQGVGYLELFDHLPSMLKEIIECTAYVVGDEASYLETFEDVLRGIKQWAVARFGTCPALLEFGSGIHDSLDRLIDRTRGGLIHRREYLWYLRVPEIIPFLWHIQPVLERRLQGSGAHRYTGELKIGFYDLTGISLKFERGRLMDIASVTGKDGYDISFPWHMLWNVVFGQHTYDEMHTILPEVAAGSKGAVLMDALFPKKKSWIKGMM
ncbi:MAG: GNAT family N-acetyltransferase [Anaerolineae bacterium]|nr:GNAT family N-acetyltransferase [Anaerolineae bacterium]